MKTIYILFNYDALCPIGASTDRATIEELTLSCFEDDFETQVFWDMCGPYSLPRNYKEACEIVNEAWKDTKDWYNNYMEIIETEVFD